MRERVIVCASLITEIYNFRYLYTLLSKIHAAYWVRTKLVNFFKVKFCITNAMCRFFLFILLMFYEYRCTKWYSFAGQVKFTLHLGVKPVS